jgi:hypothetical protein
MHQTIVIRLDTKADEVTDAYNDEHDDDNDIHRYRLITEAAKGIGL